MDREMIGAKYTAVLLAAGYGSRISDMTNRPKSLLKINELTLLEHNFENWKKVGIKHVHLVLGYEKELIEEVAKKYEKDFSIEYFFNEDYRKQGNTFSLYLGVKDLSGACLIFDADLVYDAEILVEFLKDEQGNQILVGAGELDDIESAKTMIDDSGMAKVMVDKRAVTAEELSQYQFAGEAIGILKFSPEQTVALAHRAQQFLAEERNIHLNWEHLLNQFLLENEVGTHLFKEGRWIEIDTPADFEKAQEIFEQ